jgi:hypothetical protein
MIGLLSDLCLGRNYRAINQLQDLFPSRICFKIVSGTEYNEQLRGVFTKLITTLIVDKAPWKVMALPDKLRIWTDLDDDGAIGENGEDESISCSDLDP